ncbi:MAG: hypothetical protein ABUU24_01915, partial [Variovorax sp.]
QRCNRRRLLFAQTGYVALGLLFLASQSVAQIRRALLCTGGALSKGRKVDPDLLLLARPGGGCIAVRGLLGLKCLLGGCQRGAR